MKYEIIEGDQFYHIYNRGNNKEDIFKEVMNYSYFLNLMRKYIVPIADVLSYCLLKNHFHLLIKTKKLEKDKKFSQAFSNMCNAYAKAINKKYNRTGSLFQTRFKRIKISDENYLRQLIIYINLNHIYHGFTSRLFEYEYSSLLLLLSKQNTFLKRSEVMELFEDKENFHYCIKKKKLEFDEKMIALLLE